jgi:hypothetical protein
MRELAKSIVNYAWAMSLFGVQQTINVLSPQGKESDPTTKAFNNVAGSATGELGTSLAAAYRAGDNLQRGMVDSTFRLLSLGFFNCCDQKKGTSTTPGTQPDVGDRAAEALGRTVAAARLAADTIGRAVGRRE